MGLGNPGPRYESTRHNAGFWFVDALAAHNQGVFKPAKRFHAELCELQFEGQALRLLKPGTYMNLSGNAVAALINFYRLPVDEMLVVYDEIDLPPGTVRLKRGGGHAGHNGLRDIIAKLGERNFARLRLGVGHPGSSEEVVSYVLRRAPAEEQKQIDDAIEAVLENFPQIIAGEFALAMNSLHSR